MKKYILILALLFACHVKAQNVPTPVAAYLSWTPITCPTAACQFGIYSKAGACPSGAITSLTGWTEIQGMPASRLSYKDSSQAQGSTTSYIVVTFAVQPTGPPLLSAPSNCVSLTLTQPANVPTTLTVTIGPA